MSLDPLREGIQPPAGHASASSIPQKLREELLASAINPPKALELRVCRYGVAIDPHKCEVFQQAQRQGNTRCPGYSELATVEGIVRLKCPYQT